MKEIIKEKIREIPDWPEKGVSFKDITPLLQDKELFPRVIDCLAAPYIGKKIDKIIGIDARGFILASALAYKLKTGLAIVRKKGKLPWQKISKEYSLEYASNVIEIHKDAVLPEERALLVDDVLATGGTMRAAVEIVEQLGGQIVAIDFLIELSYLNGREKLQGYKINSLIKYKTEKTKVQPLRSQSQALKTPKIAIIGGSGFYNFFEENTKEIEIETRYGRPSDKIIRGNLFNKEVYFLPRHGKKHSFPPHKIPYRANIKALKELGVDVIIAPAAVGSLKAEIKPGDFVICDQFINKTLKRKDTFFEGPQVRHIETAYPFCQELRKIATAQSKKLNLPVHPKGAAIVIEGPRFSTLAESLYFSKSGGDIINMTIYPEAVLAAELGICYLNISLVTDYDVGIYALEKTKPVSVGEVLANFKKNTEKLKSFISVIVENIPQTLTCDCKKKAERAKIS